MSEYGSAEVAHCMFSTMFFRLGVENWPNAARGEDILVKTQRKKV